jgi:hypothetical protein
LPFHSLASPDLEWYLKFWGKQILDNDLCQWSWWSSRALVENQGQKLTEDGVALALDNAYVPRRRLHNPALQHSLSELDAVWFDKVWQNIQLIENEFQRALAYAHALAVAITFLALRPRRRSCAAHSRRSFSRFGATSASWSTTASRTTVLNRDAHEFVRGARVDLLFARFPRPQGLTSLRNTRAGWRESWVRGGRISGTA